MADLEEAADVALVKVKELQAHVEKAEAALAAVEQRLGHLKERTASDWAALAETAASLLEGARAQAAQLREDGQAAHEACAAMDEALTDGGSAWDPALDATRQGVTALGAHVAESEAPLFQAGDEAETALRDLGERAAALEAELRRAVADARHFLEREVVEDLREMRGEVRERAAALQASLADECAALLDEAYASWETRVAQVEEVLDQEFAGARQHLSDVVEFSLEECRQGHDEVWEDVVDAVATLEGRLQRLAEAARERDAELGERRASVEQALGEAAARMELMSGLLRQELDVLASYDFVNGGAR
jgi:hypothetical protein